ncbi:HAD hydrolase-like protein [Gammaproteobacteria bacterium]|nr:HAD hydrolase-like protein [Gammaproteobacteria bacterium]MDA9045637.1 HAD hydrolase-like protein [Gammaproteobacteria bacterium]
MNVNILSNKKYIFWDFDGVIKDSVEIKSNAYEDLFLQWGQQVSHKVRDHHRLNGGMSRFDKIPLYLSWTNESVNEVLINKLCNDFSNLVKYKVINSPWVPGVVELISHLNYIGNNCFIVTATPQDEIIEILHELKLHSLFKEVIGAPTNKSDAIKLIIEKYKILKDEAIMLGDSKTDLIAARDNNIDFILRKTDENKPLQENLQSEMIDDFL